MTLREYLLRQRVELISALSRNEVVRLINAATPSVLVRSQTSRVRGKYHFGRLHLFWDTPNFRNAFRPVFSASVSEDVDQTVIRGRWGATRFTQIWFLGWYSILCAAFVIIAAGLLGYLPWNNSEYAMLVALPLFSSAPLIFAFLSIRDADEQLRAILGFLDQEAKTKSRDLQPNVVIQPTR